MNDQSVDKIKQQLQLLYPQLFDDPTAKQKLDPLLKQSSTLLNQYRDDVSDSQFQMLMTYYTSHLLYQIESQDTITSVHVTDASINLANPNSGSGSSSSNGSDPYLRQFLLLLSALGIDDSDWRINLG